jgi:hypothetical protein
MEQNSGQLHKTNSEGLIDRRLLNDSITSAGYLISNDMDVSSRSVKLKYLRRNQSWPVSKYYPTIRLEERKPQSR